LDALSKTGKTKRGRLREGVPGVKDGAGKAGFRATRDELPAQRYPEQSSVLLKY